MRIGFALHGFPPREAGGVELVAAEQAEGLAAAGHEVGVYARALDPRRRDGEWWRESLGPVSVWRAAYEYRFPNDVRELWRHSFLDESFFSFLDEFGPEVIHFQHLVQLSTSFVDEVQRRGIPYVISLHDFFYPCHRLFLLDADGARCDGPEAGGRCMTCLADQGFGEAAPERFDEMARVLAGAAEIMAPARSFAARYAEIWPFLEGRVQIVPTGSPDARAGVTARAQDRLTSTGAEPGSEHSAAARLVFAGSLLPHKGIDRLVRSLLPLDPETWTLDVWGRAVPGHEDFVEELREASRDAPVRWRGEYGADGRPAAFASAQVLVLPSRCDESYSRVLDEARASGLTVVAPNTGGPADRFSHERDALLFDPGEDADLERQLRRIVADPDLRMRLASAPYSPPPDDAVAQLEKSYRHALAAPAPMVHASRPARVTVAYVTKNGGALLEESLEAVRGQRGDSFDLCEILAVDSGSKDGSLAALERAGARVERIPAEEFEHGRTRNHAASLAEGEITVFLTQDAIPADDGWLEPLVATLRADPQMAGTWSRHLPHPDCHPMEARQIVDFPLYATGHTWISDSRSNPDFELRRDLYVWFSNNSSAIPTALLRRKPFPKVRFAEDQAWAAERLAEGWRTSMVAPSTIRHSHSYSAWENLQRNFDHARAMVEELDRVDPIRLSECFTFAVREMRSDLRFAARGGDAGGAQAAGRWRGPSMRYQLAAFFGRWLGARYGAMPAPAARMLSLYERHRGQ